MQLPFFTDAERLKPLRYQASSYEFTSPHLDLSKPLLVTPRSERYLGFQPAIIAAAVADFTAWWVGEIHPRLNGTNGLAGVEWVFVETVREAQALQIDPARVAA
jgi:hypothetical protein